MVKNKSVFDKIENDKMNDRLKDVTNLIRKLNNETLFDAKYNHTAENLIEITIFLFGKGNKNLYNTFCLDMNGNYSEFMVMYEIIFNFLNDLLSRESFKKKDSSYIDLKFKTFCHLLGLGIDNKFAEDLLSFVDYYHGDQVDKGGQPYLHHLYRVSLGGNTIPTAIGGLLHDGMEDTDMGYCNIKLILEDHDCNCSDEILSALLLLTKDKDKDNGYDTYIDNITTCEIASYIKLNDLNDNLDLTRLGESYTLTAKDHERFLKYYKSRDKIISKWGFKG